MSIKIKDLTNGTVRDYGDDHHDSLSISQDGRYLTYYNLQNGDGSRFGEYRFVMDDEEVPEDSTTAEAMNGCCYFNVGGFQNCNKCDIPESYIQERINEELKKIIKELKESDLVTFSQAIDFLHDKVISSAIPGQEEE